MTATKERSTAPGAGEYAEFYAGYVKRVPPGDVVATIRDQMAETLTFLRGIDPARTIYAALVKHPLLTTATTERRASR